MTELIKNSLDNCIGSIYGTETLTHEYKEFYLRSLYKYFNNEDLDNIIHNSEYKLDTNIFNTMIKYELERYFTVYCAKYSAIFIMSQINGFLHFGITDNGIIEGIPYYNHSNTSDYIDFSLYISDVFKQSLKMLRVNSENKEYNNEIYNWYINNISINIIKLQINDDLLDDGYKHRLLQLKNKANKISKMWEIYKKEYDTWYNTFMFYSQKLRILMNDTNIRKNIIEYINTYVIIYKLNESEYINSIKYYKSDSLRIQDITMTEILEIKNDYNNPINWLIEYKDHVIDNLRKIKPKQPTYINKDVDYYMYLSRMCNLIPYLKDKGFSFYKIKINVPYNNNFRDIEHKVEYFDNTDKWLCKKRVYVNNSPITIDINK